MIEPYCQLTIVLIRKLLNRKFVHNGDNNKRCLYSKTSQECKKTLKLTSLLQNQFPKFIHFGESWRSLGRQVTTSKTKSSVFFKHCSKRGEGVRPMFNAFLLQILYTSGRYIPQYDAQHKCSKTRGGGSHSNCVYQAKMYRSQLTYIGVTLSLPG